MQGAALAPAVSPPSEWADASVRFTLQLNPGLMARLGIESWAAFKQVPRRGLEIGGILLGRTEVTDHCVNLYIDGYRTVDSEHRWGPSYLLSEGDSERLQEEIRRSPEQAVGLFRTHTRSQDLALDASDSELLTRCFGQPSALFLLLAPVPGKAGIYTRVEGELKSVFECPIASSLSAILALRQNRTDRDRATAHMEQRVCSIEAHTESLLAMERGITGAAPPLDGPPNPLPQLPPPQLPPPIPERRPVRPGGAKFGPAKWGWAVALVTALLSLAAIATISRSVHRPTAELSFLRLTLQPTGSSLRLSWDPRAPALKGAIRAVLHVDDGDQQSERILTEAELKSGTASYQPRSGNVTFRVDVYPAEAKTVAAIQFLSDRPSVPAAGAEDPSDDGPAPSESAALAPKAAPWQHKTDFRGMSVALLTPMLRSRFHLPPNTFGIVVMQVSPGSAADQAAIQEGDVIREVDRRPVAGIVEFEDAMQYGSRRAVLLSVEREGAVSFHAVP